MCPVCLANMVLIAAGATSSGGIDRMGDAQTLLEETNETN